MRKIEGPFRSPPTHRDNKGFQDFKKVRFTLLFLKSQFYSPHCECKLEDSVKWTHRECVRTSLQGKISVFPFRLDQVLLTFIHLPITFFFFLIWIKNYLWCMILDHEKAWTGSNIEVKFLIFWSGLSFAAKFYDPDQKFDKNFLIRIKNSMKFFWSGSKIRIKIFDPDQKFD